MKGGNYSPAKKAKACKNVVMRMMAVVLVYSYALTLKRRDCIRVLTRNKRVGIMGERSVYASQKADSTIRTPPTTNSAMAAGEFPKRKNNCTINGNATNWIEKDQSQLVSLWLKPNKRHTTPPTISVKPWKSNSATCSRNVLSCSRGLKCRLNASSARATPPVGLQGVKGEPSKEFLITYRFIQKHLRSRGIRQILT